MTDGGDRVAPFPAARRATVDYMRVAGRRSVVHGLLEVDVTAARAAIDAHEAATGEAVSFTAFLVERLARAVEAHPACNTYRDWRGRLHTFDDVDVNVLVERPVEGRRIGVPHVVRAANRRPLSSIHEEIRATQAGGGADDGGRLGRALMRLPAVLRRQVWRLPQWFPRRWRRLAGTVSVSSVGMFGEGGGWAVTPTAYTLQLTVGGIETKPRYVDGAVEPRELLSLTVTVDHDVVDGAPAARFVGRLRELLEQPPDLGGTAASG